MREFILRARKAPSTPDFDLADLSRSGHMEIVAHCLVDSLFYSRRIRDQTVFHLVLEGPAAPPKYVRFESDALGSLGGLDDRAVCSVIQQALEVGRRLGREQEREAAAGVFVAKRSFESLVRAQCAKGPLFYLQPKGTDIRAAELAEPASFVFTDHLSMPSKSDRYLERLGARPLSVGPRTLLASQCIVLVHNELDRRA
ncbi:MAG: tRNA (pseudouridine(54)-N(1))-methyltransferase TrmY [Candidatus Latescibacteria bacterium]|nr:tRNA (pseudouridine(54)-N(1))-methyltransferase TrmY [Candidatus Latescibacterota bacterium]